MLRRVFRSLPNKNSLSISNKHESVSIISMKHWINRKKIFLFINHFLSPFFKKKKQMKEKNLKLMFHFKIPRGNFLLPSDMNIVAKPRGVYMVWWQWWIYFALWGKKFPQQNRCRVLLQEASLAVVAFPFCSVPLSPISLTISRTFLQKLPSFHLSFHQLIINLLLLCLLLGVPAQVGPSFSQSLSCPSVSLWLAFKSFSLHLHPIFSPVGLKKKKFEVKKIWELYNSKHLPG